MATIFHLALASDWAAAQDAGAYTISTRGRTLAQEGFIHASRGDQWPTVRDLFYGDVTEPLLLLQIDTERLDVPVVEEAPGPGTAETFPHIYGPLALDAVVKAIPVPLRGDRGPAGINAPAPVSAPAPRAPGDSFGRVFLTEMLLNAALLLLIMVTTAAGLWIGLSVGEEVAAYGGLALGAIIGGGAARVLYRRRHG